MSTLYIYYYFLHESEHHKIQRQMLELEKSFEPKL